MKLSTFKNHLSKVTSVHFILPNGNEIPEHFHITEVGQITKKFIDCGGTVRNENVVNMQLWESSDTWHRLEPQKLIGIIDLSISKLGIEDHEIEIEYQAETIGKYGLDFDGTSFLLTTKQTDCLAKEKCGVPEEKTKVNLSELKQKESACCTPGGGCC